jgi:hypothetical protein
VKKLVGCRDALEIVLKRFAETSVSPPPSPPPGAPLNKPPPPPPVPPLTLEVQLAAVAQHVVRQFYMLSHQLLEIALSQLEYDRSSNILRGLQRLHNQVSDIIEAQLKLPPDKAKRAGTLPIRVMEIRPRKSPKEPHRFLDSFTPHTSRTIEFSVFNRLDNNPPNDWRGPLVDMHQLRGRVLAFYFDAYGEPEQAGAKPNDDNKRRQKLIKDKYRDQMKLGSDDDLILFFANFFEAIVRERTAAPFKDSLPDAQLLAWRAIVKFLDRYLERLTSHTKFNIAEGPKSYLEQDFPRSITDGLIHDCGVYATRLAYILMGLGSQIDRIFKGCFDMKISWILLPLHVGLLVRNNLQPLIVHNQALFLLHDELLERLRDAWETPPHEPDPANSGDRDLKFLEDVAAAAFNPNIDMPLIRMDLGNRTTKKLVWASYQRLMRRERMFTPFVANPLAPEFQFDLLYLSGMTLQREWFNRDVVGFWNVRVRGVWEKMRDRLAKDFAANGQEYLAALQKEVDLISDSYMNTVLDKKDTLSDALRQRSRRMLQTGVRVVSASRLETSFKELGPLGAVTEHIEDVKKNGDLERDQKTNEPITPFFARPEEALAPIPN